MKLTHVNEIAYLEHDDDLIYLTDEQYNALSTMNATQSKAYLIRTVKQRLTEKEQAILQRWLDDPSIDWHLQIQ